MDDIHVYPVDDLIIHTLKDCMCVCDPAVEFQEDGVRIIIHRSWAEIVTGEKPDPRLTKTTVGLTLQ